MAWVLEGYPAPKGGRKEVGRPARSFCRCLPRDEKVYTKASVPWRQGLERKGERSMRAIFS